MSAIYKTFRITLTKKQAKEIRGQFSSVCQLAGVDRAAMIAQPKTHLGGGGVVELVPPVLEVAVISPELYHEIQADIMKYRGHREEAQP
jgi:hypothetical protein